VSAPQMLRYARARAGLSQRALAERSGLAQPAIARIESGKASPRLDSLERLLAACGFRLDVRAAADDGIDRTAMRELLRLTPAERLEIAAEEGRHLDALIPREKPEPMRGGSHEPAVAARRSRAPSL